MCVCVCARGCVLCMPAGMCVSARSCARARAHKSEKRSDARRSRHKHACVCVRAAATKARPSCSRCSRSSARTSHGTGARPRPSCIAARCTRCVRFSALQRVSVRCSVLSMPHNRCEAPSFLHRSVVEHSTTCCSKALASSVRHRPCSAATTWAARREASGHVCARSRSVRVCRQTDSSALCRLCTQCRTGTCGRRARAQTKAARLHPTEGRSHEASLQLRQRKRASASSHHCLPRALLPLRHTGMRGRRSSAVRGARRGVAPTLSTAP
jgi:hypothetical protein